MSHNKTTKVCSVRVTPDDLKTIKGKFGDLRKALEHLVKQIKDKKNE